MPDSTRGRNPGRGRFTTERWLETQWKQRRSASHVFSVVVKRIHTSLMHTDAGSFNEEGNFAKCGLQMHPQE